MKLLTIKKEKKKLQFLKKYIRREKMEKKNWERRKGNRERERKGRKKRRERRGRKYPPNMFRYKP